MRDFNCESPSLILPAKYIAVSVYSLNKDLGSSFWSRDDTGWLLPNVHGSSNCLTNLMSRPTSTQPSRRTWLTSSLLVSYLLVEKVGLGG